MKINKKKVGEYENVDLMEYKISNNNGVAIKFLNLGGIITQIKTKDKNNKCENIVLAYEDLDNYLENPAYYGALVGRTSGRIGNANVFFSGKEYRFYKNYNPNSGHGGKEGFNKKIWTIKEINEKDSIGAELSYFSKNGEEGYPGNVEVKVSYILNNDDEFIFTIEADSDEDTLFNMTNHSYFNLSGDFKNDINSSYLKINSDEFLEVNETNAVTGTILKTRDTPFDFTTRKLVGQDILEDNEQLKLSNGYDHPFLFNDKIGKICLCDEQSGRGLDIETNQKCVVVYTTNFPDDNNLENGKKPRIREGICFETQAPPISNNDDFIEDSLLKKRNKYSKKTKYRFYNI